MNNLTIGLLIDYLYNRYLIIFFICMAGSLTHDISGTIRNLSKIEYRKDLISAAFSAIVLSALIDMVNWNFSICVLVCFLTGIYSFKLLDLALNWKFVKIILLNVLKNSKGAISDVIVNTTKEFEKEIDDNINDKSAEDKEDSNTKKKE